MRLLWLIFIFLLPLSALAAETRGISIVAKDPKTGQAGEVQLYRKTFAVIVGIDRYQNLPRDKQLKNAVNDARGIEAVLRKNYRFDEIITLTDEEATKDRILEVLTEELPARMTKDDALFLFWAGHGNQENSEFGELGYLIPYDGSIDKIRKNLNMFEFKETIGKKLPAKHVFYVMDACYSGLMADTRSLNERPQRDLAYLKEITKESVRQVLTAGDKGQEALDGGPKGHSVFTGRLIEVLEAAGDFVTANEIQVILHEKVFQDARARNHTQTPRFGTLYGNGDFVFVPNAQQKVADVAVEVAKLEAEMAELQRRDEAARSSKDESARRAVERERQVAEAKLRAEKLRQEQLAEETRRQEEQRREQERLTAEVRRQETELAAKRSEEEQRLAQLKAEIVAKRHSTPIRQSATIEAAVAEIKRISKEIDTIEAEFKNEAQAGEKRIKERYSGHLSEVRDQEKVAKGKSLVQGEFETDTEFSARKMKSGNLYSERIKKLERQQQDEVTSLRQKIEEETATQTATLRSELLTLSNKEYTLDSNSLALEVGRYDLVNGTFPFTLTNKSISPAEKVGVPVRVAMNGTIRLPRDDAKEWKQQLENGFVHPQVAARPDGHIVQVVLANDATADLLLTLAAGAFTSLRDKEKEREKEKEKLRSLVGELVPISKGCYQMGNIFNVISGKDNPVHEVCVDAFAIGQTEVTQVQWRLIMGNNPSYFSGCDSCPVERVSWNDIQEYLRRLNTQTFKNYRLPTEAEWEYAARSGGRQEIYAGGDKVDVVAWYKDNSSNSTHPVGQKKANGLGLYDMTGNVSEWCSDWYAKRYYDDSPLSNPQGPSESCCKVHRGGNWEDYEHKIPSCIRDFEGLGDRKSNLGFRLATDGGSSTF